MPQNLPPVEDDIFEALQALAVPLVDDVNSVLRRLLGLSSEPSGVASAGGISAVAQTLTRSSTAGGRGAKLRAGQSAKKKTAPKSRAPRGSLLPESEYELPMLRYLAEQGGRAPAREVVEAVGIALKKQFTPTDLEPLDSGDIRWKSRTQFVRLKLIREGTMTKDAPRGVWEVTDLGRDRVNGSVR